MGRLLGLLEFISQFLSRALWKTSLFPTVSSAVHTALCLSGRRCQPAIRVLSYTTLPNLEGTFQVKETVFLFSYQRRAGTDLGHGFAATLSLLFLPDMITVLFSSTIHTFRWNI